MYHHQFADPLINYSDPSLMGSSSSSNNNCSSYEGFNPVQGTTNYQQHCFDPNLLQMLSPENFQHHGFIGEVPDSVSQASAAASAAMFYELTVFHSVLNQGSGGSLACEEGCAGQVSERTLQLGRKRKKKGVDHQEGDGGPKNEKQRRERLSKKYEVLKQLIPNPTTPDRATIVADAISSIQGLLRTVLDKLNLLVEKKRRRKSGSRIKPETNNDAIVDSKSSCMKPLLHHDYKGAAALMRSSWVQRKSKDTQVDVRIVEDEVFIKLSQHRKVDCLHVVARVLDELELEMLYLSGGNIGDLHVFMFNTKIHEGSAVYAEVIAKKIIEAMDVKYPELVVGF